MTSGLRDPRQANMVNDDVGYVSNGMSGGSCYDLEVNLVERLTMDKSCIWAKSATADIKGEGDVIFEGMTIRREKSSS
ncbi:hypothetical protein Tco_0975825 [Tanacetum coccineum]|uniref:Uncharacterized protein n=1 Tax=Tanacetum coccineum TaxID=301880 RepID=A0ABQ5EFH5_9ASTR